MRKSCCERSFFISLFRLPSSFLSLCQSGTSHFIFSILFSLHHFSSPSPALHSISVIISSWQLQLPSFPLVPPRPSLPCLLSRQELCCSLVCSPHCLTPVCPSHLAALLRSHLQPPFPPFALLVPPFLSLYQSPYGFITILQELPLLLHLVRQTCLRGEAEKGQGESGLSLA